MTNGTCRFAPADIGTDQGSTEHLLIGRVVSGNLSIRIWINLVHTSIEGPRLSPCTAFLLGLNMFLTSLLPLWLRSLGSLRLKALVVGLVTSEKDIRTYYLKV